MKALALPNAGALPAVRRRREIAPQWVKVLRDVESELHGRDVVIVDDILDSGRTLAFAKTMLVARGSRSVRTCVLLDKEVPRAANVVPDFTGFRCKPVFVVGYGMDLAHRYRELPFIGEVSPP